MTKTAKCQGEYNLLDPICTKCGEHVVRHHPVAIRGFKNQDYENKNEQPVPDVRESDGEPPANPASGRNFDLAFVMRDCGGDIEKAQRRIDLALDARDEEVKRLKERIDILSKGWPAADILRLETENKRLREALEFYANQNNWHSTHGNGGGAYDTINNDCENWYAGKLAREALKDGGQRG